MSDRLDILKNRTIIDILIGDVVVYAKNDEEFRLSYLSGPKICTISEQFGLKQIYGSNSRWVYFENLIVHCIDKNIIDKLFTYVLQSVTENDSINSLDIEQANFIFDRVIEATIGKINLVLKYSDINIKYASNKVVFELNNIPMNIVTDNIKVVNNEYIVTKISEAKKDIEEKQYDSALTKCRLLVEEILIYAIEIKNEKPSESGDIKNYINK